MSTHATATPAPLAWGRLDGDNARRLLRCTPIRDMERDMVRQLLEQAELVRIPQNQPYTPESASEALFLLEGRALMEHGGRTRPVLADSEEALESLLARAPGQVLLAAGSLVCRLHLGGAYGLPSFELTETDLDESEGDLMERLFEAYRSGSLSLPAIPEAALRIRTMLENDDIDIGEVARIAQGDPVLAGSLIQAANSALFGGNGRIAGVRDAVARLGTRATHHLAMAVGLAAVFRAASADVEHAMNEEWRRSKAVAGIAFALARSLPHLDAERALLVGLLHRVGAIPVLIAVDEQEETPELDVIVALVDKLMEPAAALVVADWHLDEALAEILASIDCWVRQGSDQANYLDLVQFAMLVDAHMSERSLAIDLPDCSAAVTFGVRDESMLDTFVRHRLHDIEAAQAILEV